MEKLDPSVAQQIAQAAIAFQQQRTGHEPKSVAVVLSGDTLLITLHGRVSPARRPPRHGHTSIRPYCASFFQDPLVNQ